MMQSIAVQGLISMVSHIVFIIITWRLLQEIRFEGIFKKSKVFEARLFLIFVTITIGTTVSRFFLDFLVWSQQLVNLF
ncbi:DUF1146 family protein [Bacillaceae bacterium S4-13-58]